LAFFFRFDDYCKIAKKYYMTTQKKITILGLGYVGLPLAVEFAKSYSVVGFDINEGRIADLNAGVDNTLEVTSEELQAVLTTDPNATTGLFITNNTDYIADSNIYIVTVPTPTDALKRPVFTPLIKASQSVAKGLNKGDIVIYESTVYPGATEDICVPVLEEYSGLVYNQDFFCRLLTRTH
jgi:UDP-N-acetyl-D-galactosamine dehydrogenase